ncbi:MAG: DUF624 domain-containing protein [Lachnospiraceae bacterium]|nr:DUF624 domain-containing protein [Lachnospiraceae bacterium]
MGEYFELTAKIWNMFILSIIFVICCIPIVTIGAATTAYCYMFLKYKDKREGRVFENYFKAFKREFAQSTKVWLIILAALVVLFFDARVSSNLVATYGGIYFVLYPFYYLLLFIVGAVVLYVFPYMAKFTDTTTQVIKNSFLISLKHLGYTVTTLLIDYSIIKAGLDYFLPITIITPLLIGWINVSMINVVLKKHMPSEE